MPIYNASDHGFSIEGQLPTAKHRPIYEIAQEIARDWKNPYFGAVPYLAAMREISSIEDAYYNDSAKSVVLYFLANASTWRGMKARSIKAELKAMTKDC